MLIIARPHHVSNVDRRADLADATDENSIYYYNVIYRTYNFVEKISKRKRTRKPS